MKTSAFLAWLMLKSLSSSNCRCLFLSRLLRLLRLSSVSRETSWNRMLHRPLQPSQASVCSWVPSFTQSDFIQTDPEIFPSLQQSQFWNSEMKFWKMTYCLPSRESWHAKSQNWLCAFSCEGHSALRLDLHNLNYNVKCRSQHEVKKRWKFKLQRFEDRLPTLNLCLKLISALWATYLSRGPHCSILTSVHKFQHDLIVTWRAPLNDTDSNKNNSALMGHEEVPGRKERNTNNKLFLPYARLARLAFWQPSHSFHTTLWLFDAITQLSQLCAQKWLWPRQEKQVTWLHCHDHLAFAFWTSKETQFLQIVWVCDVLVCLPLQILQPINCIKTYYQK